MPAIKKTKPKLSAWHFERRVRLEIRGELFVTPVRFLVTAKTAREADKLAAAESDRALRALLHKGVAIPPWDSDPVRLYKL